MKKIIYYVSRYKILIILVIALIVLSLSILLPYFSSENGVEEIEEVVSNEKEEKEENEEKEDVKEIKKVKVDIKGYVKEPGVYEVEDTSRVIDVINSAGGLTDGANTEYLNLSKVVQDQMVIIVYSNDEISKFKETDKEVIYIEKPCKCPDNENDACISKDDVVNTIESSDNNDNTQTSSSNTEKTDTLVSINSGTLSELMTLSGIGESKAKAIIEYREKNNGFKTLDELMNVSGIGEKTYSKIKDSIKL